MTECPRKTARDVPDGIGQQAQGSALPAHDPLEFPPLKCPWCGFDYLHHDDVDVWVRHVEDTDVDPTRIPGTFRQSGAPFGENPSPRRSGLRIHLTCEGCPKRSALEVIQHKGQTFLSLARIESEGV